MNIALDNKPSDISFCFIIYLSEKHYHSNVVAVFFKEINTFILGVCTEQILHSFNYCTSGISLETSSFIYLYFW